MAAGLGAYRKVLADPRARAFSLAGLVARMPLSMTGLGIVLLVSSTTGSFGVAGLITAVATLTGAVAAPIWGRLIDRVGQARVLVIAGLLCNVSLSLLLTSVLLRYSLWVTITTAVGVGLGFSSAGSCVRARWTHHLKDRVLLDTAYAFEAVVDEVVFIVGPVLVTFLATSVHPGLGLATTALLGLIGALALARLRDSEPPVRSAEHLKAAGCPLSVWVLVPIVLASSTLGMLFGGMELVIVAFAKEAGVPGFTGFFVMIWASGSLVSGVVTGTLRWRMSPTRRVKLGALGLASSVVPLSFVHSPLLMGVLLVLSGSAIAPTLIASVAVVQASVPDSRLTEALGWTSMGMATGVAAGAAVLGLVVDTYDAQAGFLALVGVGVLLTAAVAGVRTPRPRPAVARAAAALPDTGPTEPARPPARTP